MHEYLLDENGDTVIGNLPDDAVMFSRDESFDVWNHTIHYIVLPDSTWWWNVDGADLLWGPHDSIITARKDFFK